MEYTTDIRELDNLYLATIGGVDYYEVRQIVKQDNGVRSIVGRASDWPVIEQRAQNADLAALLVASERRSVEADCHCVELLTRLAAYAEHIAALEAAIAEWASAPPQLAPAEANAAEAAFLASIALLEAPGYPCPDCPKSFRTFKALGGHRARMHGAYKDVLQAVPTPTPPIALPESPFRCSNCGNDTHARSLETPAICIRCAVGLAERAVNGTGHRVAA